MNSPTRAFIAVPAVALMLLTGLSTAHAATPGPIRAAYEEWIDVLEAAPNCEGEAVADLYAPNAVLLATFTDYVKGAAQISKYFDNLTCYDDLRVETNRITTMRKGNLGYATGLYTFSYGNADGTRTQVPARFTFVFDKSGNNWRIVNHHSSVTPE